MLKYIYGFIIISFIACGSTIVKDKTLVNQKDDKDKILWSSNRKLTWSDFKGKPPSDVGNKRAETHGAIVTDKTYWENGIPKFIVNCYFLKNESWTITRDSLTLEHEQIHFDIYELFTRKIRKSFDSLNNKEIIDFKIYQEIFNEFLNQNYNYNNDYDDDVRLERLKQQMWIDKIVKELEELKEYE